MSQSNKVIGLKISVSMYFENLKLMKINVMLNFKCFFVAVLLKSIKEILQIFFLDFFNFL